MEDPATPPDTGEVVVTARRGDDAPSRTPARTRDQDELTLTVGGRIYGGWDEISVTRSCERMPSNFAISLTERWPGEAANVVIRPMQECVVKMGDDTVLTGRIDRYLPQLDAKQHRVTIVGRSKSRNLVDCSAIFESFQISGQTVGQIATTLAGKYGINVATPTGPGPVVPQLNLQFGETPWSVIERLSRFAKFLAYDDPDGNVLLRTVSEERHASGLREGENAAVVSSAFTGDGRYSEYHVHPLSVLPLMQAEIAAGGSALPRPLGEAKDDGVPELRRLIVILEHAGTESIEDACKRRAEWEASRRRGRSEQVTVTVDSWRDRAGKLWEPNRRVAVHMPTCQVHDRVWTIGEVTYSRGANGTSAALTLMPPEAFEPEYQPLMQFNFQQVERAAETGATRRTLEAGGAFRTRGDGPGV